MDIYLEFILFLKIFYLNYSKIKIFTILFTELFISFQLRF